MRSVLIVGAVVVAQLAAFGAAGEPPTVNVREHGAIGDGVADDRAAIQKALDGGRRTVVIPAGTYKIGSTLLVDSHTTIRASEQAIIRLADGAGVDASVFLLDNRDHANGNTDITVAGGVWDGNNPHNPRGREGDPNGYTGSAINFINVQRLNIENVIVRNPEAFSIRLCRVSDFQIENLGLHAPSIRPNQDGVHINGHCFRGVIRNVYGMNEGSPNDDLVALNADDSTTRVINLGMEVGPIEDITVEKLRAEAAWNFVRMLSVRNRVKNVTIRDARGTVRYHGVNIDRWRFPFDATGHLENVTMRDLHISNVDAAPGSTLRANPRSALLPLEVAVRNFVIENFTRVDDLPAPTLVVNNRRSNEVRIAGLSAMQVQAMRRALPWLADKDFREVGDGAYELNVTTDKQLVLPGGGFRYLRINTVGPLQEDRRE